MGIYPDAAALGRVAEDGLGGGLRDATPKAVDELVGEQQLVERQLLTRVCT